MVRQFAAVECVCMIVYVLKMIVMIALTMPLISIAYQKAGVSNRYQLAMMPFLTVLFLLFASNAHGQNHRLGGGGTTYSAHLMPLAPVSEAGTTRTVESISTGEPLVGVVSRRENRLFYFGVLQHDLRFPDVILYLDNTDPHADVNVYCMPYDEMHIGTVPYANNAPWSSSKSGEMFISAKTKRYNDAVSLKERNGENIKVAGFGCAVHTGTANPTKFQVTVHLSFDQRKLHPEHESALREMFRNCCTGETTCYRWVHQEKNTAVDALHRMEEVEFDFCHRLGSFCNAKGDILRLSLRSHGLKCKLPVQALLKLTTLESLDLSGNNIHADVNEDVAQLGSLRNLKELDLAHNYIFGEILSHGLCQKLPKNLRTIDMSDNYISGHVPSCLFTDNYFLHEIDLSRNHFSGYISDLFPPSSQLKSLALSGNGLAGSLPPSLGRLKSLKALYLDGNSFNGPIPDAFIFLKSLEVVDLSHNRLSGFPASWSISWEPSRHLRVLRLQNNRLSGRLPSRLLRAGFLEWLDLSRNYISGPLFSKKGMFPRMTTFNLSANQLTGSIPQDMVSMGVFGEKRRNGARHVFDVSFNNLKGDIPEFMYQETTRTISETEIYLEGASFSCHRWRTLNRIPNFECVNHDQINKLNELSSSNLLEDEDNQRHLIASIEQNNSATVLSSNSEEGAGFDSGAQSDSAASVITAVVAIVVGGGALIGVVVLIIKFNRNRHRRLGLQYGAPDDGESGDDDALAKARDSPGPSTHPHTVDAE